MQHITKLEIYNGLRHFYTPSLLPKNTLFQVGRKKKLQIQC